MRLRHDGRRAWCWRGSDEARFGLTFVRGSLSQMA